jgi:hypothetical protein
MDDKKLKLVSILVEALMEERAKVAVLAEALGIDPAELTVPTMRESLVPWIEEQLAECDVPTLAMKGRRAC